MNRASRTRTAAGCAALAALVATGLSACGSSGGSHAKSGGAGGGSSRTLTIQGDSGNPTLVENFNPFNAATELHGAYLIYEPLMFQSPIDGSETPFLATGMKFTDPTTLVVTLRQGVKWSDGKPFTADDVVFTFDMLKKYPAMDGTGVWQQISGVTASGNTVTFKFKAPNVPFAGVLAQTPIVPKHLWASVSNPATYTNTHPVGTGPFELAKFSPNQYSLTKNPTYWQASKVAPSKVVFPAEASNQSTNQLQVTSGDFDWAYTYLPDVQRTYVARNPKQNSYWFPPGGVIGLYLNLTKSPYNNVDFRKGISAALDRPTIARKAVNGYMAAASQSGVILPNLQAWLDPSLPNKGIVTQNKGQAMADFAKAGYHLQGGKLIGPGGTQASMTIVLPNSFSDWVAAATEVANELRPDGIAVRLDTPQFAAYTQATQTGTFDAAIGGFGGTGVPYTDFNNALNSTFATPVHTATANNFERFKDPKVDAALAALAGATSHAAQEKATHQLEQVMYNQVPIVLMYYGGSWGLFSTKNFKGWPSASNPYTLPTNYNYSLLDVAVHLSNS